MKQPLEDLETSFVEIESINSRLEGVSKNFSFGFKYTNIGDEIEFIILGRGKNKFPKILNQKKNNHEEINCEYFGKCGGCKAQHLNYEKQFFYKTENIHRKIFENFQINLNLIPATKIFNYRNRMDFAVFPEKIGLRQENNFRNIIDINECKIQSNWANEELKILRKLIQNEFREIVFDRKNETGFLKYITLRTNSNETDTNTIFTFIEDFDSNEQKDNFKKKVLEFSTSKNILFCYNRKKSENSCEGKFEILKGNEFYIENFFNKKFTVPFNSFSQPNLNGFTPILEFIDSILEEKNYRTLIDLFCGNGFFSILFGEKFQNLVGFDIINSSIEIAKNSLGKIYTDKKILFHKKDLLSTKESFDFSEFENPILILDPPRNGVGDLVIKKILDSSIKEIIYVSCNPNSQLEDLVLLREKFKPISGLITDPYPQTPHLESVIYLKSF